MFKDIIARRGLLHLKQIYCNREVAKIMKVYMLIGTLFLTGCFYAPHLSDLEMQQLIATAKKEDKWASIIARRGDISNKERAYPVCPFYLEKKADTYRIFPMWNPSSAQLHVPGTAVYNINRVDISDMNVSEMISYINNLYPKEIIVDGISYKWQKNVVPFCYTSYENIAYIRIFSFEGDFRLFTHVCNKICEKNFQSVIIDLRNNTGGKLQNALLVADQFVSDPKVFYRRKFRPFSSGIKKILGNWTKIYKRNAGSHKILAFYVPCIEPGYMSFCSVKDYTDVKFTRNALLLNKKLVFLVNKNTASASELLVAGLNQYGIGKIFGEKTLGKNVAQQYLPIQMNRRYSVRLTSLRVVNEENEYLYSDKGIMPDVNIPDESLNKENWLESDRILIQSLRYLQTQ